MCIIVPSISFSSCKMSNFHRLADIYHASLSIRSTDHWVSLIRINYSPLSGNHPHPLSPPLRVFLPPYRGSNFIANSRNISPQPDRLERLLPPKGLRSKIDILLLNWWWCCFPWWSRFHTISISHWMYQRRPLSFPPPPPPPLWPLCCGCFVCWWVPPFPVHSRCSIDGIENQFDGWPSGSLVTSWEPRGAFLRGG